MSLTFFDKEALAELARQFPRNGAAIITAEQLDALGYTEPSQLVRLGILCHRENGFGPGKHLCKKIGNRNGGHGITREGRPLNDHHS
jgi:hypothetical protein